MAFHEKLLLLLPRFSLGLFHLSFAIPSGTLLAKTPQYASITAQHSKEENIIIWLLGVHLENTHTHKPRTPTPSPASFRTQIVYGRQKVQDIQRYSCRRGSFISESSPSFSESPELYWHYAVVVWSKYSRAYYSLEIRYNSTAYKNAPYRRGSLVSGPSPAS